MRNGHIHRTSECYHKMQHAEICPDRQLRILYAAGLIAKLSGVEISDDIKPIELGVLLHQEIEKTEPKDEQEKYLFSMLKEYKPTDEYDEQMKELLLWGKGEQYLWTVTIL